VSVIEGLLEGLNERQRAAVEAPETPLCIRAGAGTGKTRVLTRRIAHQAGIGAIDPKRTLAITFTRKAADELRERLAGLGLRGSVSAGTFHSTAYAQLRTRWAERGIKPPELVQDKRGLVARSARQAGLRLAKAEVQDAVAEIEWAKAHRITPGDYCERAAVLRRWPALDHGVVADLYLRYEGEKLKRRVVDFDDLLILALRDLTDDPDYAEARRWSYRHLFVDEFQDVNQLQFDLLRAWLGDRSDLCAVGDPNQAIYSWNGADSEYIERFAAWFPGAEVLDLVDNYRSTPQILAAGRSVLPAGAAKLASHSLDGPRPTVSTHANDFDEATAIARSLRDAKGPETAWSSMAVLARTNAQTGTLAAALHRSGIPYRVRANPHRIGEEPRGSSSFSSDAVEVATFHAAKGLEWPIVHLAGLEQGLMPISRAKTPAEVAEERRLLYVAITRADQANVVHCLEPFRHGRHDDHIARRDLGLRVEPAERASPIHFGVRKVGFRCPRNPRITEFHAAGHRLAIPRRELDVPIFLPHHHPWGILAQEHVRDQEAVFSIDRRDELHIATLVQQEKRHLLAGRFGSETPVVPFRMTGRTHRPVSKRLVVLVASEVALGGRGVEEGVFGIKKRRTEGRMLNPAEGPVEPQLVQRRFFDIQDRLTVSEPHRSCYGRSRVLQVEVVDQGMLILRNHLGREQRHLAVIGHALLVLGFRRRTPEVKAQIATHDPGQQSRL